MIHSPAAVRLNSGVRHVTIDPRDLSIRAASVVAADCVEFFCKKNGIADRRLSAFCNHLRAVAAADDIVAWDRQADGLEVRGMGDPLPLPLDSVSGLQDLLCEANEITASQMYAAWTPQNVCHHLTRTVECSGLSLAQELSRAVGMHSPDHNGWGPPFTAPHA